MKVILPAVLLGVTAAAQATVYTGPGSAIPDTLVSFTAGPAMVATIAVADTGSISALNSVSLTLNHTWVGDLLVVVTAPNGDNVHLFGRVGCTANNTFGFASDLAGEYVFANTGNSFSAAAAISPVAAGTYARSTVPAAVTIPAPDADDYTVFNGDSVTGNWTVTITDWAAADVGALVSWSLDITVGGGTPCPANIVNSGTSANKVDVDDLLAVIGQWGNCPVPPATCPANIVNSGTSVNKVDVDDLLAVIGQWGNCPVK